VQRFGGGAELLFDGGHIKNVQSSNWKWLRTLRFIAKKIPRRKRRAGNLAERVSVNPH